MSPFVTSDNSCNLVSVSHIETVVKIPAFQEPAKFSPEMCGFCHSSVDYLGCY